MTNEFNTLRSEIPAESQIQSFLSEVLFPSEPTRKWPLVELAKQVKEYFDISNEASKLQLGEHGRWPNLWRCKDGSFLECLTYWATYRCIVVDGTAKEIGKYEYQSIKGPDVDIGKPRRERKQLISAIKVSAKLLKLTGMGLVEVENALLSKWTDYAEEIEIACKRVFAS